MLVVVMVVVVELVVIGGTNNVGGCDCSGVSSSGCASIEGGCEGGVVVVMATVGGSE